MQSSQNDMWKREEQYMVKFLITINQLDGNASSRYGILVYIDSSRLSFADAIIPND